jgi:hypothetical protein
LGHGGGFNHVVAFHALIPRKLGVPDDNIFVIILIPLKRTAAYRSVNMDTAISQLNNNVQYITSLLQTSLDASAIASLKQSGQHVVRPSEFRGCV